MKYKFLVVAMLAVLAGHSQSVLNIAAGSDLTITSGEVVSLNGLVLKPTANFTLQANTLSQGTTLTNASINGANAIARTYKFSATTNAFTGRIGFYYADGDLGAIPEASLVVNVHTGGLWTSVATGSRDLVNNYIETQQATLTGLNEFAATPALVTLPLRWGPLQVQRQGQNAVITFTCFEMTNVKSLQIERSSDGRNWLPITTITQPGTGTKTFQFTDSNIPAQKLYSCNLR